MPIAFTEALIAQFDKKIRYEAAHYRRGLPSCLDVDDLYSVGCLGLRQAAERFNAELGPLFRTYAVHRIRGAMLDEIRRVSWGPRRSRPPAAKALTPVSEAAWRELMENTPDPQEDILADLMDEEAAVDRLLTLRRLLVALPPRDRQVIEQHDCQQWSMKRIAAALGVSASRVSQLHTRAMGRLYKRLYKSGATLTT